LPDEAIFSNVAEDCLAPVGFAPTEFAMKKWPCSCRGPYGQTSHSPDLARNTTFRSQKTDNPIITIVFKAGKPGDLWSKPLAGPYRRLCTEDTGENEIYYDTKYKYLEVKYISASYIINNCHSLK